MLNLRLVENQPRWRVWLVARFAKLVGVMVHVEGIPFGSSRNHRLVAAYFETIEVKDGAVR